MSNSVQNLVDKFVSLKGSSEDMVLPVLHHIQDSLGFIPEDSASIVAKKFNLSRAEVHGVITYYHHFRTNKPAKYNIQLCVAESCKSCGSDNLYKQIENKTGAKMHEHSIDAKFSIEPVYCLGLCAASPAIQINDDFYGNVDSKKMDDLLSKLKSETQNA